jgi:hypothetical protein
MNYFIHIFGNYCPTSRFSAIFAPISADLRRRLPAGPPARLRRSDEGQPDDMAPADLPTRIAACRLCADRFAATATAHAPRPVPWFAPGARLLIAGQAPGLRVHEAGRPFADPSGDRLRDWLGLAPEAFYDRAASPSCPWPSAFRAMTRRAPISPRRPSARGPGGRR